MRPSCSHSPLQRLTVLVAGLFGIATLVAGGRILLGFGEASYAVVRPVLLFNTAMGVAYLAAAVLIVRNVVLGRRLATIIALANVLVLSAIVWRRLSGGPVANETLAAMTLRAGVWIGIALVLGIELQGRRTHERTA